MSPGKFPAPNHLIWVPLAARPHASSAPALPQPVCLQLPLGCPSTASHQGPGRL